MAVQPLNQYFRKSYQDFSGGLNTLLSPLILPANQFSDLRNVIINDKRIIEKFPAFVTDASGNSIASIQGVQSRFFIRMMVNYKRGTSVDKLVIAYGDAENNTNATYNVDTKATTGNGTYSYFGYTDGTASFVNASPTVTGVGTLWSSHIKAGDKIQKNNAGAWYEIQSVDSDTQLTLTSNVSGTAAGSAYTIRVIWNKSFIPTAVPYNNNLYITNGSDKMLEYNNTTIALLNDTNAPRPAFIKAHKRRMFAARDVSQLSGLYWSAVDLPTSYDASGYEPIYPQDNGNICAIESFANSLIVFKDNGLIYQVVGEFAQDEIGYPDFIRKIDTPATMGIIAGLSVAVGDDNLLYFAAESGIYTLDAQMRVTKISEDIEDTIAEIVFRTTATAQKSHVWDTKTQWDAGTHSGTRATTDGTLQSIFDEYTITDAKKGNNLVACAIDSSNGVHVAYVSSANAKTIKYSTWTQLGVQTSETVTTEAYDIQDLSIDVSSNSKVGICFTLNTGAQTNTLRFSERVSSTWASAITIGSGANYILSAIKYRTDNDARVAWMILSGTVDWGVVKETADVWAAPVTVSTGLDSNSSRINFILDGSNVPHCVILQISTVLRYTSFTGDFTGASVETVSLTAADSWTRPNLAINSTAQIISFFGDDGKIKVRNHSTAITSNLNTSTGKAIGFALDSSDAYTYDRLASDGSETYVFATSTAIANPSTATVDLNYIVGASSFRRNSVTNAFCAFGVNANEVLIRRIAPVCVYTTDEKADSTLTVWGTIDVSEASSNNNTLTFQAAVDIGSPSNYVTKTSGQQVNSDATLYTIKARVNVTMAAWSMSTVGSITTSYTGSAIDAKTIYGYYYDGAYYLSFSKSASLYNVFVLYKDRNGAFVLNDFYSIGPMCKFLNGLYAGASSEGAVYQLLSGYNSGSGTYEAVIEFKEDILGSLELDKEVYKAYVIYEVQPLGTFQVSYRTDNFRYSVDQTYTSTTVDQTTDGFAEIQVASLPFKSIQFKITSSTAGARLGIIGIVIVYGYLNIR